MSSSSSSRAKRPFGARPAPSSRSSGASDVGRKNLETSASSTDLATSSARRQVNDSGPNANGQRSRTTDSSASVPASFALTYEAIPEGYQTVSPVTYGGPPGQMLDRSSRGSITTVSTFPLETFRAADTVASSRIYDSPLPVSESLSSPPSSPPSSRPSSRQSSRAPNFPFPLRPASPRTHWDHIRHAFLPSQTPSASPLRADFAPALPPNRSETPTPSLFATPQPKTSRLARFGFKSTVDQARQVALSDATRQFEDDVARACRVAKAGAVGLGELIPSSGAGFASPASQMYHHAQASSSSTGGFSARIGRLRRPPSLQSVAALAASSPTSASGLSQLRATLTHYATIPSLPHLPRQSEVLSVLLAPFLISSNSENQLMVTRNTSIEVFYIIISNWKSGSTESEVERLIWCMKVATLSRDYLLLRTKAIDILTSLFEAPSSLRQPLPPAVHQSLLHHMLDLQHSLNSLQVPALDRQIQGLLNRLRNCEYARMDPESLSAEYGVGLVSEEDISPVVQAVLGEGVTRLLRGSSADLRLWLLHNIIEDYWPVLSLDSESSSSLFKQVALRRICSFARFVVDLFQDVESSQATPQDAQMIFSILRSRIIPEVDLFFSSDTEARNSAVRITLALFRSASLAAAAASVIDTWRASRNDWTVSLEHELRSQIATSDSRQLVKAIELYYYGTQGDSRKYIVATILPLLFERLVEQPFVPIPSFTGLLDAVAKSYPRNFFKPLFDCAKASKDNNVVASLRVLSALSVHLPDLLIYNSEMMTVAIMSDPGVSFSKGKGREVDGPRWSKARMGQCVILMELLIKLDKLIREKPDPSTAPGHSGSSAVRFFSELEDKLAIFVTAKEEITLMPFSQRVLLTSLFHKIRLYTRSSKTPLFLPRLMDWATQNDVGTLIPPASSTDSPSFSPDSRSTLVTQDEVDEIDLTISKIGMIYTASTTSRRDTRTRSVIISSLSDLEKISDTDTNVWDERRRIQDELPKNLTHAALPLLVLVSAQLRDEDFGRLIPSLWGKHLDDFQKFVVGPACFLFMQAAERIAAQTTKLIEDDLKSSISDVRQKAVSRLAVLFSWRHQILSQTYILDRNHRKPFRTGGKALSFVATDVGITKYVADDAEDKSLAALGASLPAEVRRRLHELDWDKSAQEKEDNKAIKWEQLPLSMLSKYTLDYAEHEQEYLTTNIPTSSTHSSGGQLLRRKSSASGYSGVRRRTVFVPILVSIISSLSSLVFHQDAAFGNAIRDFLFIIIRDDPNLICRPLLEALDDPFRGPSHSVPIIDTFIHIDAALPPSLSHHIFNHLSGYVKSQSRDTDDSTDSLLRFASVMPAISHLAANVSELSVKDLRRNKMEPFLLPTFHLWYPSTIPTGPLFPRGSSTRGSHSLAQSLLDIITIRTSQNMFLYRLLLRNPKEVSNVRRNLATLELPASAHESLSIVQDINHFIPFRSGPPTIPKPAGQKEVLHRSLQLSRSYLLVVTQLFRSLNRNTNDRAELAKLIDGINLILFIHGNELGVVSHALVAFMTASTRFRRLFSSNSGFLLFMPALIKVYCEMRMDESIRLAIEYSIHRFFALHDKTFVFQMLVVVSEMLDSPNLDSSSRKKFADSVFTIFVMLHSSYPSNAPDPAGIHDANLGQEREALLTLLSESPDVLGSSGRRRSGDEDLSLPSLSSLIDKWRGHRFLLDDLVRLLLTIIVHSPGTKRSGNFLRLLGQWTIELYNGSISSRSVLQQGIEALSDSVFSKTASRSREGASQSDATDASIRLQEDDGSAGTTSISDFNSMRQHYLFLVMQFCRAGGHLNIIVVRRTFDIVNTLLRDEEPKTSRLSSEFIHELTQRYLVGDARPPPKQVLAFLNEIVPFVRASGTALNLSEALKTITGLIQDPLVSAEAGFSHIVHQFCAAALEACSAAAENKILFRLSTRSSIIQLLSAAAFLPDVDIIALVEVQKPSASFLMGIILPICQVLRSSTATPNQLESKKNHRPPGSVWARVLSYAMSACSPKGLFQPGSGVATLEKSANLDDASLLDASINVQISLQIIKVIILRSESLLTSYIPGIWFRLAKFLQNILQGSDLSLIPRTIPASPSNSPVPSRPGSMHSSDPGLLGRPSFSSDSHQSPYQHNSIRERLRAIDYMAASLVEFVIFYRSPLIIPMRLWIQEQLGRIIQDGPPVTSIYAPTRISIGGDPRRLSSLFSKLRVRQGVPSPEASSLMERRELPNSPSLDAPGGAGLRQPGYALGVSRPSTPPNVSVPSRPIIHLGPVIIKSPRSTSPLERNSTEIHTHSIYVSTPNLIRASVQRVQAVQAWFGYGNEDVNVQAWTRLAGLQSVQRETEALTEEFYSSFHSSDATP